MKIKNRQGLTLDLRDEGSGVPVLFLHEFAGDQRSWDDQFSALARRMRCLAPAARGYPPSDVPRRQEQYTQPQLCADVIEILDALGLESTHLVGVSMGAYTALNVCFLHPSRVRSVVAAAGGSGSRLDSREDFLRASHELADTIERAQSIPADTIALGPTRVQLRQKDPRAWQLLKQSLHGHPAQAAAMILRGIQAGRPSLYSLETELRSIRSPVLLIVGDEDEPCLDVNVWLKRTIATSRLAVLPGTGHAVNLEEPATFNRLVLDFVTEVETGSWTPRLAEANALSFYTPHDGQK